MSKVGSVLSKYRDLEESMGGGTIYFKVPTDKVRKRSLENAIRVFDPQFNLPTEGKEVEYSGNVGMMKQILNRWGVQYSE